MKTVLFVIFTALLTALPVSAQDNDDDNQTRSSSYMNRSKLGGAGGITPVVGMFDNAEIDKYLASAGLPVFGSDPIYLVGGEGYGYIMFLRNVRMGGFGVSGVRSVNSITGNVKKEVDYTLSYGGFMIDYVQPIAYRLDVAVGASIGGGAINLTMRRDDGSFKQWDSLWSSFGDLSRPTSNYTRTMTGSFVTFNPHVNIEYTLLTWLQLRVGVGYPIMFSPEWKLDNQYEINGVPSKIKTDGYTVNAGIMFGFFGW